MPTFIRGGLGAPGLRVGILGGSFNPAHDGHRHISLLALKHLGLDEVWWMVSTQNPLKPTDGMAPFAERMAGAEALARHPDIRVTDVEQRLGTRYTCETLRALKSCFPRMHFVWLMGADNLAQISEWQRWNEIFNLVPIAVFDRAPYSFNALAGKAAIPMASSEPTSIRLLLGFCENFIVRTPIELFTNRAHVWYIYSTNYHLSTGDRENCNAQPIIDYQAGGYLTVP